METLKQIKIINPKINTKEMGIWELRTKMIKPISMEIPTEIKMDTKTEKTKQIE